jgi:small GTP-binding protein
MKVAIIGEFATGKTSLIRRYVDNAFDNDYRATLGTNIMLKKVDITYENEDYEIKLNLYEVAGQDRWQNVRKSYYQGSQGLIFVGDISRKRTFHQLQNFWFPDVKDSIHPNTPKLILANKCDLTADIPDQEIEEITYTIQAIGYIKTSAKENISVNKAFVSLVEAILESTSG